MLEKERHQPLLGRRLNGRSLLGIESLLSKRGNNSTYTSDVVYAEVAVDIFAGRVVDWP